MPDPLRRLILGSGESYIQPYQKTSSGRSPEPPRSFADARELVINEVERSLEIVSHLPREKQLPNERTLCLRLHPDATAKSYDPKAIFEVVPELTQVGSRNYIVPASEVQPTSRIEKKLKRDVELIEGRLVFVRGSDAGFRRLLSRLNSATHNEDFQLEIRRIERFDVLKDEEQVLGFAQDWEIGRAELVFHPTRSAPTEQNVFLSRLLQRCGIDFQSSRIRIYPDGPTFISCLLSKTAIEVLKGTNPLRAAHPLVFGGVKDLRAAPSLPAPKPPTTSTRSKILVGMFDGGVDVTNPLLSGHVEEDLNNGVKTPPDPVGVAHGTAVAGALLFGALNEFKASDELPAPPVTVVSIRTLPTSDPLDIDLYEAIDIIEKSVPARPDIKTYNLSFGPVGPILEDSISRFTYVLDSLSIKHKASFFVAVGNDGNVPGLDRIQAPSDMVHGIGVGAHTIHSSQPVHAPYSCKGPGRECGKIKPDLSAFGGCEINPIHLVSVTPGHRLLSTGTSFAAPLASRMGALTAEAFEESSSLLSRTLLVHSARHPDQDPDYLLGHGCLPPSLDDVLTCGDHSVTVIFQKAIQPSKTIRVPVPWPSEHFVDGMAEVRWTIASLSQVNPLHPGDYTSSCLEDTFHPHNDFFNFSFEEKGGAKQAKRINVVQDASIASELIKSGWKQSKYPVSESGNKYRDEHQRRAIDCKWEPLVRRCIKKRASNFRDPFMTLHAISRNGSVASFDFVIVVTVKIPRFEGDLYREITTRYPALAPIRLHTEADTRIRI